MPFRWMVAEGERTRGATSVAGLLRAVRAAVDPGYRAGRGCASRRCRVVPP